MEHLSKKPMRNKLYSEKQVREVLYELFIFKENADLRLKKLTPIELPTDEELLYDATTWLNNKFNGKGFEFKIYDRQKNEAYNYNPVKILKEYSKWMRDKIQGGNNE